DHRAAAPACPGEQTCGADDRCTDGTACDQIDGGLSDADADGCPGRGFLHLCLPAAEGDVMIGTQVVDTNVTCNVMVVTSMGEACVWVAQNFLVTGHARFIGHQPIVLLALDKIEVDVAG